MTDDKISEVASRGAGDSPSDDVKMDLLRDQWGHTLETIRFFGGLLIQTWGFLIAADAVIVAYGFSRDRHEALWVAALMPALMGVAAVVVSHMASPFYYSGLVAESRLGITEAAPPITTFAKMRADRFLSAVKKNDNELRGTLVRLPRQTVGNHVPLVICGAGVVFQLVLALLFTLFG